MTGKQERVALTHFLDNSSFTEVLGSFKGYFLVTQKRVLSCQLLLSCEFWLDFMMNKHFFFESLLVIRNGA